MNSSNKGYVVGDSASRAQSGFSVGKVGRVLKTDIRFPLYSAIKSFPFATVAPPSSPPLHLEPSPGRAIFAFDLSSDVVVYRLSQK